MKQEDIFSPYIVHSIQCLPSIINGDMRQLKNKLFKINRIYSEVLKQVAEDSAELIH